MIRLGGEDRWAILPVVATCGISLALLRAELVQVPYLNDSAMHEEMVRFAAARLRAGRVPFGSWFPWLNLGSPQFLHYQSLGPTLTGALGLAIGTGRAFTLTLWLGIGAWPLAVFSAGRLFGLRPMAAMAAAMLAPFLSSFTGVGYEQVSYLWIGFGLWSQLFAMWTLPFAWALSWRTIEEHRFFLPAAIAVAATAAFHFQTGYLAFGSVPLFALARPSRLPRRIGRAALLLVAAAALSAWAIVPLVVEGRWAAVNEFLLGGADSTSYGARRVLSALVSGQVLDWHHVELVTPLAGFGLICCLAVVWRIRRDAATPLSSDLAGRHGVERALPLVFGMSLVLFFGRPTLGPLLDLLPGAEDLFLRRFIVGVQLAGLWMAGIGAAAVGREIVGASRRLIARDRPDRTPSMGTVVGAGLVVAAALAALVPCWAFLVGLSDRNTALVAQQSTATTAVREMDEIVATIRASGGGRTFAGHPGDFGEQFTVGLVPVYEYLASQDVDEVGFTLRTASLMSDPEAKFDDANPADYRTFGIRWLVLPAGMEPALGAARRIEERGPYVLWELSSNGYVQVVDTRGTITATSSDLGSASVGLLDHLSTRHPVYPVVAYGGERPATGTLPPGADPTTSPGSVLSQQADLAGGTASATVSVRWRAVVLLSASFDPGWKAYVDGRPAPTEMVAPALVGVEVGAGRHRVRFVYEGFPEYPELFALAGITFVVPVVIKVLRRRARTRT